MFAAFRPFCEINLMSLNCPRCRSTTMRKVGISRHGHQRWLCKDCGRTFGEKNYRVINAATREKALAMYAEGVSARAIERLLGVSHNSMLGWMRQEVSRQALQGAPAAQLQVLEMDEMWSYVGSKKAHLAVVGDRSQNAPDCGLGAGRSGHQDGAGAAAGVAREHAH